MIRVEGGKLEIGATTEQEAESEDNEIPAHKIVLPNYYIGKFPVTQKLWSLVMGYNTSHFKRESFIPKPVKVAKKALKYSTAGAAVAVGSIFGGPIGWVSSAIGTAAMLGAFKGLLTNNEYPMENITFQEAKEFVQRLSEMTKINFSIPTEEEWEYAARGGQQSKHFKYAGSDNLDEVGWYRGNSEGTTQPLGKKKPNELGLYDMSGNVWEWTKSHATPYMDAYSEKDNTNIYIRRGGSWWHEAKNCRVSKRYPSDETKNTSGLGLRIVIRDVK